MHAKVRSNYIQGSGKRGVQGVCEEKQIEKRKRNITRGAKVHNAKGNEFRLLPNKRQIHRLYGLPLYF
jgi:hypothetical protein